MARLAKRYELHDRTVQPNPAGGYEFWSDFGASYEAFCSFCVPSDWSSIAARLASEIGDNIRGGDPVTVLDIGTGTGETAQLVRSNLLWKLGRHSSWLLVEAEPLLQTHLARLGTGNLSTHGVVGAGRDIDSITKLLPEPQLIDCVTVFHSSYHFLAFSDVAERVRRNLKPNGIMVILVMPEDSAFFLGDSRLSRVSCSNSIQKQLSSKFKLLARRNLRSRFMLGKCREGGVGYLRDVFPFFTEHRISFEEFVSLVEPHKDEIDFADEILVFQSL